MIVSIVNISLSNVGSVEAAFRFLGAEVRLATTPGEMAGADLVVLAGVGNFMTAAAKLRQSGFAQALEREANVGGLPVLGICLGMQLFADVGQEGEETPGFGWIPGRVTRLCGTDCKVPHIGWNISTPSPCSIFTHGPQTYYFMHSYHFIPEEPAHILATTTYGNQQIASAVRRKNFIGVQFHPEKSQGEGLRFLKAVLEEFA